MNTIQNIYKIGKQMEKIHKKVSLLNRKKESIGLTAEEEKKLKKYCQQSWLLHEELIETHLNITVIPYVLTDEAKKALKEIQKLVPWNGGLIIRNKDYEAICEAEKNLTPEQKQFIADKLEFIHISVMQQFELFCNTESGYEYMRQTSKVITSEEDGNVLDVLVYLDARYREFGELLDIELQEVEIVFGDDEDVETEENS